MVICYRLMQPTRIFARHIQQVLADFTLYYGLRQQSRAKYDAVLNWNA